MSTPLETIAMCMRQARLGHSGGTWAMLQDDTKEDWLVSALAMVSFLRGQGVELVQSGEPLSAPTSPVVWRFPIDGQNAERLLRKGNGDAWQFVKVEGGTETVQLEFTLARASELADRVLTGDRSVAKEPGVMTILAGANEIHRIGAETAAPAEYREAAE